MIKGVARIRTEALRILTLVDYDYRELAQRVLVEIFRRGNSKEVYFDGECVYIMHPGEGVSESYQELFVGTYNPESRVADIEADLKAMWPELL